MFVTDAELTALLGAGANPERVALAVAAANELILGWVEPTPVVPTAPQHQAGLELAHALYRRHAAVGGVFSVDELVSRLPADLSRSIRDLLDADALRFGLA